MSFIHLHNHSTYSVLDGAMKIKEMVARAKSLNQTALALTDHGTLAGVYDFWKECKAQGIKPIIGLEAYVAPTEVAVREPVFWGTDDQRKMDVGGGGKYTHMTLWAGGASGLQNLFKLHSASYQGDNFYGKPRVTLPLLEEYGRHLIASTGCAGGAVPTLLRLGQTTKAEAWAMRLKRIFGANLFIEVMYHGIHTPELDEGSLNAQLLRLSTDLDILPVMTNDCHYTEESDAEVHDALLCVQTKAKLSEENRFKFTGSGFYMKGESGMHLAALDGDTQIPDAALWNTQAIADSVSSYDRVFAKQLRMPAHRGNIREAVYGSERFKDEFQESVDQELEIIEREGFSSYFLVLADCIGWAKASGIPIGPGRGSVGGSLVSFVLGITDINPLDHGLLFERFLNPERVSLPDIDIDVSDTRRDDLLNYLREKHGSEHVAQILTVGTIGAKAALKDSTRVLGLPYSLGEELVGKLPPAIFGRQPTLSEMPILKEDRSNRVLRLAYGLEGLVRSSGVHAAGVVVSPVPLPGLIPTSWKGDIQVTGVDAKVVDELGFVKMDFLGLRNLDVIQRTLDTIGYTWETLLASTTDSPEVYQMLSSGHSDGVFQLDSPGMQKLLKEVKPRQFGDIAAVLALYRPGPMGVKAHTEYAKRKNSGSRRQTIHPNFADALAPILDETYGLIVYQEQIMKILQFTGDYSLGEADLMRRAMGKKDREQMAKLQPEFMARVGLRFGHEAAEALWDTIEPFADYAFNKSHSVGYALVSYWTALLKVKFPKEYMAALLSSVSADPERLPVYLKEVRRMGIPLLPPDVNMNVPDFAASSAGIHYGLAGIKGFGEKAFEQLKKVQPFKDLDDFFRRAPATILNVGVLHALIRSGALDRIEPRRVQLDGVAEAYSARVLEARRTSRTGRRSLFQPSYKLDELRESIESVGQYIEWETDHLGLALTKGKGYLYPTRQLSESDWDWVADLVANCPGETDLYIVIDGIEVKTEFAVDVASVRTRLAALWAFDLEKLSNG